MELSKKMADKIRSAGGQRSDLKFWKVKRGGKDVIIARAVLRGEPYGLTFVVDPASLMLSYDPKVSA